MRFGRLNLEPQFWQRYLPTVESTESSRSHRGQIASELGRGSPQLAQRKVSSVTIFSNVKNHWPVRLFAQIRCIVRLTALPEKPTFGCTRRSVTQEQVSDSSIPKIWAIAIVGSPFPMLCVNLDSRHIDCGSS